MKKVLVIYYSQSGQLTEIVKSILTPLHNSDKISLDYEVLRPKEPYPFPWNALQFCNAFPESFAGIPCELEPFHFNPKEDYDLVILAYQVWYLSPSIPVNSFLQSAEARKIIRNRPVVTIIGCRNMWTMAQEKVKTRISDWGGQLKGNIVLADRSNNLVGILTIVVWMLTGNKGRFLGFFPWPGISDKDIREAERFGGTILKALYNEVLKLDQMELNAQGAVNVIPSLIFMEKRASKIFKIWSEFIRKQGGPGNPKRRLRVRLFTAYLIIAVIILAPLSSTVAFLVKVLKKGRIKKEIEYFSQNLLKDQ